VQENLPLVRPRPWPLAFSPNTRGFLYYHTPPKAPPLVGEVRFRLANDLDKFHDGEDLLTPNKAPWSIPLYALANRSGRSILRDKLLLDGLISQMTVDKWAEVNKLLSLHSGCSAGLNRPVLYHRFDAYNEEIVTAWQPHWAIRGLCKAGIFSKPPGN
jgi:hypothetical protein